MNIEELYNTLKRNGIVDDKFYLHGLYGSTTEDGKISLSIIKGKYFIEYHVYEMERGEKFGLRSFMKEEEACKYVMKLFNLL